MAALKNTASSSAGGFSSGRYTSGENSVGDGIEFFDQDDPNCNVDNWLAKLDQLGDSHGLSESQRSSVMLAKLKGGPIKRWFQHFPEGDMSWTDCQANLKYAFAMRRDFAFLLERMVSRQKMDGETLMCYFQEKVELCRKCDIVGEQAVSSIISGLPEELQAKAYALHCKSPEELRKSRFLLGFDGSSTKEETTKAIVSQIKKSRTFIRSLVRERCYNCQQLGGHLSRDCPKARVEIRCNHCKRIGHKWMDCPTFKNKKRKK